MMVLSAEINKLESERDSYRAAMERDGMFQIPNRKWMIGDERFAPRYQRLDDLNDKITRTQQKLISLELGSIAASSQQFNKNIGRMNDSVNKSISDLNDSVGSLKNITDDSMKSLNSTTQKLLDSSTTLEILTGILIIVSIVSLTVTLIPLSSSYAFVGLLIAGAAIYLLILLLIRVLSKRLKKRRGL
jgi:hypothetical protein